MLAGETVSYANGTWIRSEALADMCFENRPPLAHGAGCSHNPNGKEAEHDPWYPRTDGHSSQATGVAVGCGTIHKLKRCPEGLEQETCDHLPDALTLRRVTAHIAQKGRRTRHRTLIVTPVALEA